MIGVSTSVGPRNYWTDWVKRSRHSAFELDLRHSYFPPYKKIVDIAKKELEKTELSIHSCAEALFSELYYVRKGYQFLLEGEVSLANALGAKEIVFHAPPFLNFDSLKEQEGTFNFLDRVSDFARDKGVRLLIEYPSSGPFTKVEELKKFLERFPEINVCMDVGHLHRANNNLNYEKKVVENLSQYIVYVHVNDCSGEGNLHRDIKDKEMVYGEILNHLKKNCYVKKLIIEANNEKDASSIHGSLRRVYNGS